MKAIATIRKELKRVTKDKQHALCYSMEQRDADMLYGAEQALAWILSDEFAPPHRLGGRKSP